MHEELATLLNQAIPEDGRANVMVHCPLHEDRHPSLSLSLSKGVWYCHACGKGGGVRRLAQMLGGDLDAADLAVTTLKLEPDKPDPDFTRLAVEQARTLDQRRDWWGNPPELVSNYLSAKKLSPDVVYEFALGYRPDAEPSMAIPYWDGDRCLSIQYRYADGSKRQETGGKRILYNVNKVRGAETVIVCEGESDTHRMWSELQRRLISGVEVCGVPGAASGNRRWELWSLDLLWATKVYVAFDADEAGDKGAEVAMRALGEKAIRLRPEGGKDWCDEGTSWEFINEL
jgi:DNA primase